MGSFAEDDAEAAARAYDAAVRRLGNFPTAEELAGDVF